MLKLLSFFFIISCQISLSQTTITGKLLDPQNQPVELASIVLLSVKDSTVVNYTITDKYGAFKIIENKKGTFLLQASSMGYKTVYKTVNLKGSTLDLKNIKFEEDMNKLDAVTISAVIPIQIKKDTVAYSASAFKVHSDDNLESLLGKLPGVEIDSEGNITAQGNEVRRIFIDGKEVFSGDPSIVLKNLSADVISKVEVIDKKSDESELTGIDDGNKEVVINLTLKSGQKNKGFGKIAGGSGLDDKYFINTNYNRFSSKTQLSVIGKFNNINITGSNISSFLENANGISDDSDDQTSDNAINPNSLTGFLTTRVAGINIGQEFREKEFLNANYFYNHSNNYGMTFSKRINFAANNNFILNADNNFNNTTDNHNLNYNYESKHNKTHTIKVSGGLTSDNRTNLLDKKVRFIDESGTLSRINAIELSRKNKNVSGSFNIDYFKRLTKSGRSFVTGIKSSILEKNFINDQNNIITRNVDKTNESQKEQLTFRDEKEKNKQLKLYFNFSEPLWKGHQLKLLSSASTEVNNEDGVQKRITVSDQNIEETLLFKFNNIQRSYDTGLLYNFRTPKWFISSGVNFQDLNRIFGTEDVSPIVKNQFYVNPTVLFQFKPKQGTKHRLLFKRIIRSPRSRQITTVVNNLNPFSIRTGNPDLKTEKISQVILSNIIHDFKSSLSFHSRIQFQFIDDAINSNVVINDFVRTHSFINSGQNKLLRTTLSFSKKIKSLGIRYTLKNKNLFRTSNTLINNELNDVITQDFAFNFWFENTNKRNLDLKTGLSFDTNQTSFSLVDDLNRTFQRQDYYTSFDYDISEKFNFNSQLNYIIFTDNKFSPDEKLPLWNAALSYTFSENNNQLIKLVLIDLLNQNIDIYRRSTVNYFEENTTPSLGRYVILSYTYRLGNNQSSSKKG
ncbi:outer membrane beta-barrel protein [Gaetbulibacter sp. M240]|uniref:outer membrane beta-barrel protein n=1 Tax=Gaetbulibacter sp. M240 TaxID=3126511 RepID=UPI00374E5BF6